MTTRWSCAVSPDKIPVEEYILATEKATWLLPDEEAEQLRSQITGLLKKAKPPAQNISKEERQALKELKREKSIMILPADKGRATVVMDKEEYEEKVKQMLSDKRTYEKLSKDPTPVYKKKLVSILSRLKDEGKITYQQYQHLYPTTETVPRMYCTPKIHKKDNPLRPIVDYTGTMAYNTSRALADILSPLIGKTEHHVKNSKHLSEEMTSVKLN